MPDFASWLRAHWANLFDVEGQGVADLAALAAQQHEALLKCSTAFDYPLSIRQDALQAAEAFKKKYEA